MSEPKICLRIGGDTEKTSPFPPRITEPPNGFEMHDGQPMQGAELKENPKRFFSFGMIG